MQQHAENTYEYFVSLVMCPNSHIFFIQRNYEHLIELKTYLSNGQVTVIEAGWAFQSGQSNATISSIIGRCYAYPWRFYKLLTYFYRMSARREGLSEKLPPQLEKHLDVVQNPKFREEITMEYQQDFLPISRSSIQFYCQKYQAKESEVETFARWLYDTRPFFLINDILDISPKIEETVASIPWYYQ